MKRIKVKYLTVYYTLTRKKEEYIKFEGELTLRELLDRVSQKYGPKFRDYVMDEENRPKPYVWIFLNREREKDLERKLEDGEVVVFGLPIVGG